MSFGVFNNEEVQKMVDHTLGCMPKEYLQGEKLAEATDNQFGEGCSEYVAHAIQHYYGA